jgi:hypothetical protein
MEPSGGFDASPAARSGMSSSPCQPGVVPDPVDAAMAWELFERCVPAAIQDWLREDPALMAELRACLSGNADPDGVLSELVAVMRPEAAG